MTRLKILHQSFIICILLSALVLIQPGCAQTREKTDMHQNEPMNIKINKTEEEWRKLLSPVQFHVLREKGTEKPYTGEYDKFFEKGIYSCAACGQDLFISDAKFNSGCGWPSFFEPMSDTSIISKRDLSYGMIRTEIMCSGCGGHLGHVFDDGRKPTGLRYCMNSVSLKFRPAPDK